MELLLRLPQAMLVILEFYFDGAAPYDYTITVIGDDTGTAWEYVAGCPQ